MEDYTWLYELARIKPRILLHRERIAAGRLARATHEEHTRASVDCLRVQDAIMATVRNAGYTLSDIDAAKKRRKKKIE